MSPFHFALQKALDWRRGQLEVEETRFKRQAAELAVLDRTHAELESAGRTAGIQVREWTPLAGRDLAALDGFRLGVKARVREIAARRAQCQQRLAEQRSAMLEARRRCRLLERLREQRYAEWVAARDRELEEVASESFLAQWHRRE
jgi:hypothetical protein